MIFVEQPAEVVASSVQSAATLWAAVIAGIAGLAAATLSAINAHRARHWTQRDQWWQRFTWACEKSVSQEPGQSEMGLSVLEALIAVPWATDEDNEMAIAVANTIVAQVLEPLPATETVNSEPRKGWWPW
ncbi:hypothetical protein C5C13_13380 [Clavibacter michiganensis]|nr:hypothetical protein C5C13_13380 [Clavibacter michiganensis]